MKATITILLLALVTTTLGIFLPVAPVEGDGQLPVVGQVVFQGAIRIQNATTGRDQIFQGRSGRDGVPGSIPLNPGDVVLTGTDNSRANTNLANGAIVWMQGRAGMRVSSRAIDFGPNSNSSFTVLRGDVRVRVNQYRVNTRNYEVVTPSSVAGVRGTEFMVGVAVTGSVQTMVFDGAVNVAAEQEIGTNEEAQEEPVEITANEGTTVDLGGRPARPSNVGGPQDIQDEAQNFQHEEDAEAEADPAGTMGRIHRVIGRVREGNENTVETLEEVDENIQADPENEEQLSEESAEEIQDVDRTIVILSDRNEALQGLATEIAEEHPDNTEVQQVYTQVQDTYLENNNYREEFGDRIASMAEKIDRFVAMQEEKFDRFTGGELDF